MRRLSLVRSRGALGTVAAASLFVALVARADAARADTNVCTKGPYVEGVDVYGGDGTIDWKAAYGAGIRFAYIKATQGNYYQDTEFKTNWTNTKAAGVLRGAYHFFDPNVGGMEQATYFLAQMGALETGDLPPMLDIECPDGDKNCLGTNASGAASAATISKSMHDFLNAVQAATGKKSVIYTFGSYFSSNSVGTTGLDAFPLYIAYPTATDCFNVPSPWGKAAFWQWSWNGRVAGIGGGTSDVDRDRFIGTPSDLLAFADGFDTPAQVTNNDAMSIVNWPDGHVELFAMKPDGTAVHAFTTGASDTWSAPAALSGAAACGLASAIPAPSSGHQAEVFDAIASGDVESLEFTGGKWTAFASLMGKNLSHASALAYGDGRVEVFALGADGAIWHDVQTKAGFGGFQSLGGSFVTGAGPIVWGDGHAEIFVTDAKGAAWHLQADATGNWGNWSIIGGGPLASRPIPARWSDGHVTLFARGVDGALYASDNTMATWPAFTAINATQKITGEPSVLVYPAAGPEVFARDASGNVIHLWNESGKWSAWANDFNQKIVSDPMAWLRSDGTGEVFGIDAKGDLVKSLHDTPTWSAWSPVGSGFDPCVDGIGIGGAGDGGASDVDAGIAGADGGEGGTLDDAPGASAGCACRAATMRTSERDGARGAFVLLALAAALARRRGLTRRNRETKAKTGSA
jgi:lysozyme